MSKEILDGIGQKLLEWLNSGEAFVSGQIPDVVQQLLVYKMYESAFEAFVGAVLLLAACLVAKKAIPLCRAFQTEMSGTFLVLLSGALGAVGLILFSCNVEQMLKIYLAPKVFLLEYAKGLIK